MNEKHRARWRNTGTKSNQITGKMFPMFSICYVRGKNKGYNRNYKYVIVHCT